MNFDKWQHYLRARLFQMLHKEDAALQEYRQALLASPDFARAAECIAFIHANRGDFGTAVTHYEAATLPPMNPHAWYALGMAHHHLLEPERVTEIIMHLRRFDPHMTRHLIHDTERADLAYLVAELVL